MTYYIKSKKIFKEDEILLNYALKIKNKKIVDFVKNSKLSSEDEIIDYQDKMIIPGMIDLHIHGAVGKDVMDGDYEALNEISKYLAETGVTSFLATTLTAPISKIKKALINISQAMKEGVDGAEILGSYLEGPYLTEEHKGAHPTEFMRELNLDEIKGLLKLSNDTIKVFALAPEKNNSHKIIKFLEKNNIKTTMAHTNASYEEASAAVESGLELATHTFNGMKGLHHREPGALGAILNNKDVYSELIADNIHVHPAALELLLKIKGSDKVILISDCMRAGGLSDGEYMLGELKVSVKNSIARTEAGSLAGSTLELRDAVINIKEAADIDLYTALKMVTIVPARLLGMDKKIGSIEKGKNANIAVVDEMMNIYSTVIDGKIVYRK
jgi:N-acetylglucosamine-6-phosphate deacetylase